MTYILYGSTVLHVLLHMNLTASAACQLLYHSPPSIQGVIPNFPARQFLSCGFSFLFFQRIIQTIYNGYSLFERTAAE